MNGFGRVGFGFPEFAAKEGEEPYGVGHASVYVLGIDGNEDLDICRRVRPIVSIDIKRNDCDLDIKEDTNGERRITLKFGSE